MQRAGSYISLGGSNIFFILNPKSRDYSPGIKDIVAERWPRAKFFVSSDETELHDFGERAATAPLEQTPLVVACGGDGTFRIVATAVANRAVLGIVPMGTVNLVAYQLGIPRDIHAAIALLEKGRLSYIYPGCCSWDEGNLCQSFFLSVSMGADADAVHYVSEKLKALSGRIAYAVSFISRLLFHPLPSVEYTLDGKKYSCSGIIVVTSGCYGGRNIIADHQNLQKPGIEIISIHPGKKNILGFFLALFSRIGKCSDFASFTSGTCLELSCPPHGRFQIDGDKSSATKISIRPMNTPLVVISNFPECNRT